MSESCRAGRERPGPACSCPASGHEGQIVEWLTVAALVTTAVPAKQLFWMCTAADCDVVYYGQHGAVFGISDLVIRPGFKTVGSDALICYCFLHRRGDIEQDLQSTGATSIAAKIAAEIKAGSCACTVRSPTGRCCLGSVNAEIGAAKERFEIGSSRKP